MAEHNHKSPEMEAEEEPNTITPCFGRPKNPVGKALVWYLSWVLPGFGMFSEAYIIFSLGQIKPFQTTMFKTCFKTYQGDCTHELVSNQNYIQICGIIAGMLFFGVIGDIIGRKWGSRIVAAIMLSGCILLTFTPFTTTDKLNGYQYLVFFIIAETWYGFGVGGEYPMASSSASERAEKSKALHNLRGREVILTFSGQGMGNLTNGIVILISMAIFNQTKALDFFGSRDVMALQAGIGALLSLFLVWYRFTYLHESEMFTEEHEDVIEKEVSTIQKHKVSALRYWPRVFAVSMAWIANDFAFYGNKLFQSTFIGLLYPTASQYLKQQYTILNSAVALVGYFFAAWLVDKPWYGRVRCQYIGFLWMFVLYIICAIAYPHLLASTAGLHGFQFLYFFSSFWNQFGPNCTTWLLASECFPTDIRSSYCGFNAAMGKVGAIIAGVCFSYVDDRNKFYLSAAFGIFGAIVTIFFQPDTTGMDLEELDRLQKHAIKGEFEKYHGEAVNPKYLSLFERYVLKWDANYDPELDRQDREAEAKALQLGQGKAYQVNQA